MLTTRFRLTSSALQVSLLFLRTCSSATAMGNKGVAKTDVPSYTSAPKPKVTFTEEDLRERLSADEYRITQEGGTERAGTGPHLKVTDTGEFTCVVCGNQLFKTDTKYDSGSGWPSFYDVVSKSDSVVRIVDNSLGVERIEVQCGKCGAHLGHVFNDGPKDTTGLRYCINGACLRFKPEKQLTEQSAAAEEGKEGGEPKEGNEGEDSGEPKEGNEGGDLGEPKEGNEGGDSGEPTEGNGGDSGEPKEGNEGGDSGEPKEGNGGDSGEPKEGNEGGDSGEPTEGNGGDSGEPKEGNEGGDSGEPKEGNGGDSGEPKEGNEGGDSGETKERNEGGDSGEPTERNEGGDSRETKDEL